MFSELDDFGTDVASDELEEYLNTPTIMTKLLNPLIWWHAIRDSPLSRMAIDFLSAPGESGMISGLYYVRHGLIVTYV